MEQFKLSNSDIRFSRLALGTWGYSGAKVWGAADDKKSIETINAALDYGINVFDTSARYGNGHAQEVLGKALKGRRDQAVVCSKVHTAYLRYEDAIKHCDDTLQVMGLDYLDVYQIHWPSRQVPPEETLEAFAALKKAGKIREMGVCNFGLESIRRSKEYPLVTNQLPYNLIWRLIEKNDILKASVESGMNVWAYVPLAQGLLTGKFKSLEDVPMNRRDTRFYSGVWAQGRHNDTGFEKEIFEFLGQLSKVCDESGLNMIELAFGFLKAQPYVSSILVGARDMKQLQQNIRCFETQVPQDLMDHVTKLSDQLKDCMGTNADLWENQDGGRLI